MTLSNKHLLMYSATASSSAAMSLSAAAACHFEPESGWGLSGLVLEASLGC